MKPRMKISATKLGTLLLAATFLMAGCVTINIYFPASAAEKAADRIIDEVWQATGENSGEGKTAAPPATDKTEKP